jgi:Protein of unknown function (DUF1064)
VRGWENVTVTDLARLARRGIAAQAAVDRLLPKHSGRHKYRAEPCIVAADGTVFTETDILLAEQSAFQETGTGTLKERAARCRIFGTWFASLKEGKRFIELTALAKAGAISDLRLQVPYDLTVVSKVDGRELVIGKWLADFVYRRRDETLVVTEDTKGFKTPLYLRSKKHFQAQYGLPILET